MVFDAEAGGGVGGIGAVGNGKGGCQAGGICCCQAEIDEFGCIVGTLIIPL